MSRSCLVTETGSLIQLLPEIPTDSSLNLQSRHPVANSAVTAAVSQIEDGLLDSNIVKVTECIFSLIEPWMQEYERQNRREEE